MSEIRRLLPAPAAPATGKKGRSREPELPVYLGQGEEWKLTTAERKRILLNNIYGVDIDRQAVEVTKLSLLLKVLEGENEETHIQAAQALCGEGAARPEPEHQVRQLARSAGIS